MVKIGRGSIPGDLSTQRWYHPGRCSRLQYLHFPGTIDTSFDRLVSRAGARVDLNSSPDSVIRILRGDDPVLQVDPRYLQDSINILDIAFDVGSKIFCGLYSPRFQRGTQGARQSAGYARNNVIQSGWIFGPSEFSAILVFIKMRDSTVNSKMERFTKTLDRCSSVRSLVLFDPYSAGMDNRHFRPPLHRILGC